MLPPGARRMSSRERFAWPLARRQLQEAARGVAAWLARNERAEGASENGTAAAIAPESPLDGQLIASHAEDLAIEDALVRPAVLRWTALP